MEQSPGLARAGRRACGRARAHGAGQLAMVRDEPRKLGDARGRLARYLEARPELRVHSVAVPVWWARDREFEFLAPGQIINDLDAAAVRKADFDPSAVLVISPSERSLVSALRARFPDATIEAHKGNTPAEVAFYVFRRSGSKAGLAGRRAPRAFRPDRRAPDFGGEQRRPG